MLSLHQQSTCEQLDVLLDERIRNPERKDEIDERIRATFEREVTTFVLDMSGFSRLVQRFGIIHYLAMIRRMRSVVGPAVELCRGSVVKFEADNCFAVFENPDDALEACRMIHERLDVLNQETEDTSDVFVCIGIGHGPILLACDDMYGNELNLASKLGEDTAEKGEVLLTQAAFEGCNQKDSCTSFPLTVSGVTLTAFKWVR